MRRLISSSSVTITDPLVKYQSLLATGLCCPDPAQHRLAVHLQKVYFRLKDYSPSAEYRTRLAAITDALTETKGDGHSENLAVEGHPIRRNPLLARFFSKVQGKDTLALTRVLTSHDEAIHIDSPQGLFLSGEVGTGKSMLLDLLAEGLPTSRKRRWHFNTFILHALSQLERHRKMHSGSGNEEHQYSLLWMAKEMIETSPILFLDEFQLPDKAASKILSNLFTAFFQLGGVLVASSNRMPEELERATGFEYGSPAKGGLFGRALLGRTRSKGDLFGSSSDFASFLAVLKARCELWNMEGAKDWRRRDPEGIPDDIRTNLPYGSLSETPAETPQESSSSVESPQETSSTVTRPEKYYLSDPSHTSLWDSALRKYGATPAGGAWAWKAATMIVYGRQVTIPQQCDGHVLWNFDDLVSSFGPADYITMASTYHTFIIDNIPILVLLKKNEARRFITLLDALYEARCKLIVRAAVGPDDLFFPDARRTTTATITTMTMSTDNTLPRREQIDTADAIHSETIAEAYQDQVSPFRPNISSYTDYNDQDQDSDFGVDSKTSRIVDFSNTGAFTGEDERFAYKRAVSRLWELCGERWHARQGNNWWQPLPMEMRHWEGGRAAAVRPQTWSPDEVRGVSGDVTMGTSIELKEHAGLQRLRIEDLRDSMEKEK